MKVWILLAGLWLAGCGGLNSQSVLYLRQSQPFQQNLQTYQQKLKQVPGLPPKERAPAASQLLATVQADHKMLQELQPSDKVMPVHKELEALYTTMEEFIKVTLSGSGDRKDPRVARLSKDWANHLDKLNTELGHLGP